MKFAAAAIWHETLSFAHTRTEIDSFRAFQLTEKNEVLCRNDGVRNEMGGFIAGARNLDITLVPLLFAGALPSPTVSANAYGYIRERLLNLLNERGSDTDGLLLALHGAMVVEGVDDPEKDLLEAIRQNLGPDFPIVVTLDLHANVSEQLFGLANVLIAYDTYPHVDIFDRGLEAVHILKEFVDGQPVSRAFRKLPLLTVPQSQGTANEPMRSIMERVHRWESDARVRTISVMPGYPYSDVPRLGFAIAVYTDSDSELANRIVDDLANFVWNQRQSFAISNTPAPKAVEEALASEKMPVVIVDAADNIGGGTPGDGTVLLQELIRQGATDAVVTIADPDAVLICLTAGLRATVSLAVGGKYDNNHGDPVAVTGYIRLISDGVYHHAGSYMTGMRVEMGATVVLVCEGVEIVLMERKAMPFDAQQLLCLGIDPAHRRILVVKSAIAWRSAYGEIAQKVITADTPGLCTSNVYSIPYSRRPRLFPLEGISYAAS